jgi:hypothetical protein
MTFDDLVEVFDGGSFKRKVMDKNIRTNMMKVGF